MRYPASILVFASLVLFAGEARAHIRLTSPQPRTESQKQGPCGKGAADQRGPTVATFKPGETITVTWNEFINHPGHFRIALDEDGQDGFFDPEGFDDVSGGPGVLMDGIAHQQGGGDYSVEVELPDVECDDCVLQIIQMMTDKPPYGDGNDLYYQCADIAIVAEAEGTGGDPGTTGAAGTTDEPDSTGGASEDAGDTASPVTTSTGGEVSAGEQPTTGAAGSSTGAGESGGDGTGDGATDGADKESGCGCRGGDAGGLGWLAGSLLLPLARRRRG